MVREATESYEVDDREEVTTLGPFANPQPTPDPGAVFLHRPWCPVRYDLHDPPVPGASTRERATLSHPAAEPGGPHWRTAQPRALRPL